MIENKVDDDLYSRSILTYGLETLKKLSTMKILIIGMRGLGVETEKILYYQVQVKSIYLIHPKSPLKI